MASCLQWCCYSPYRGTFRHGPGRLTNRDTLGGGQSFHDRERRDASRHANLYSSPAEQRRPEGAFGGERRQKDLLCFPLKLRECLILVRLPCVGVATPTPTPATQTRKAPRELVGGCARPPLPPPAGTHRCKTWRPGSGHRLTVCAERVAEWARGGKGKSHTAEANWAAS